MGWLTFNTVATTSAAVFYLFLLSLAFPAVRAWAGRMLTLPHPATQQAIAALDVYRGLAASVVTMAHIWVFSRPLFNATQEHWWNFLCVGGNKAVPIFVILSGFLIFRAVKNIRSMDDLGRYVYRRFLRIYPVYLFTLILAYAIAQARFDWPGFLSQVFMVRVISPVYNMKFVNPPAWSLFVEVLFYAALPVWFAAFGRRVLTAAAVSFWVLVFVDPMASRELWLWKYFFVGVFVSEVIDRYGNNISERCAAFCFWTGGVLLCLDFYVDHSGIPVFDWFDRLGLVPKNTAEYTVGLAFACALILIGTLRSPTTAALLSQRPFRALGAISYSLFLIHPFFLWAVFPKFSFAAVGQDQNLVVPPIRAPAWYAPFVMFPGALVWAAICFVFVERPFLLRRPR